MLLLQNIMCSQNTIVIIDDKFVSVKENGSECKVMLKDAPQFVNCDGPWIHLKTRKGFVYWFCGEMDLKELECGRFFDRISGHILQPGKHKTKKSVGRFVFSWFMMLLEFLILFWLFAIAIQFIVQITNLQRTN